MLSIFNIPHILCKIYSTNIFTYIVYITSTVDTVHVAHTIYILSRTTYTMYIYIYVQYIYIGRKLGVPRKPSEYLIVWIWKMLILYSVLQCFLPSLESVPSVKVSMSALINSEFVRAEK